MSLDAIESGIDPQTLEELGALDIRRGQPLVALDCDEVLVEFSGHLARWLVPLGYEMRLRAYRLEGSIFRAGEDVPLPFDDCLDLIDRFFTEEAHRQAALPGAVEAARALGESAQVVVLTNVPRHAREDRLANLARIGVEAPLVVNSGGKGRALAWLSRKAAAPVVFVDDSTLQLASAAKHAPEVGRVYFTGSPYIRGVMPDCPEAHLTAPGWDEALAGIGPLLAGE
ncbi:hypothetical protein M1105_01955 [Limibaculum sp. FT325]|uniref:hypothetical protein n=1 Tax=Thermohalobaculum sediminis TaxID=2939436 RepID=UPI0020BF919B|nr:hypothetical protein [Limibaculum sediminis]MCL5775762.1 hypothetical protein [Limibaculum sediminis]